MYSSLVIMECKLKRTLEQGLQGLQDTRMPGRGESIRQPLPSPALEAGDSLRHSGEGYICLGQGFSCFSL